MNNIDIKRKTRGLKILAVVTTVVTYMLMVAGGVVRVTGSGLGCGVSGQDWPLCHGRLVPPADLPTIIEFTHRMFATLTTILIVALALVVWIKYRHRRGLRNGTTLVAALLIVQILLGAITVEAKLSGPIVLVHLANALLLLGVLLYVDVAIWMPPNKLSAVASVSLTRSRIAAMKQARSAAVGAYLIALSGALVVADGAGSACAGWPLCGNGFRIDSGRYASINLFHRLVAGIVVLFLGYTAAKVMRAFRGVGSVRLTAMFVNLAILTQVIVGAILVESHLPTSVRGIHLGLGIAVWASAALLALVTRAHVRNTDVVASVALGTDRAAAIGPLTTIDPSTTGPSERIEESPVDASNEQVVIGKPKPLNSSRTLANAAIHDTQQ